MRKLIVQEWVSLDGYTADRNDKLDFFAPTVREIYKNDYHQQFLDTIDCILFGRRTYEQFVGVWPTRSTEGDVLAKKMNTAQKIVFSNSIAKAPWGTWQEARIEMGDPIPAIKKLKSLQGKNMIIWGSISLVQVLICNNLIDNYHLLICPTIIGGGRKLFPEGINTTDLTLIESKYYESGVVRLNYQVNN